MWPPEPSQSPEGACTPTNAQDQIPTTQTESASAISHLLTADHIDMNMLSTLLGSTTDIDSGKTKDASESTELHSITTEAVLRGIHSLDEFERQAATHNESSYGGSGSSKDNEDKITAYMSNPNTTATGFGSFNETELSAALEQLYWDSLDLPIASSIAANADTKATAAAAASESSMLLVAPTPTPTPVTTTWAMRDSGSISAVANGKEIVVSNGRTELTEDEDEEEESEDVDNPLELEELSLFSLFLSDMPAFETFLENLSLNQLRQCAATVNRALAHRENSFNDSDSSTKAIEEPVVNNNDASFPDNTLALLREWLPPSTADCVIAALKAADLTIPGLSTGRITKATSGSRLEKQTNRCSNSDTAGTTIDEVSNIGGVLSPATDPAYLSNDPMLETDNEDIPWLSFVYAQKGKPRRHRIRIDIDRALLNVIPSTFKNHNCVYPRANCSKSAYAGNRWNYETECNGLGWRLAFLNQELMSDRRGLLQTAVNNYRTLVAGRKSRRITRLEKAERNQHSGNKRSAPANGAAKDSGEKRIKTATTSNGNVNSSVSTAAGSEDKEQPPPIVRTNSAPAPQAHQQSSSSSLSSASAKCLNINAYINGKSSRIRVYVDFGSVDALEIGTQFRTEHAVFPRVLNAPKSRYSGGLQGRWEFELTCNEIAWRLAWLNRSRLQGRVPLIQRCLDAYRTRFTAPPWSLLLCYKEQMGESVDPRFFDYWKPRPGKNGMELRPSPTTSEPPAAESKVLAKSATALPSTQDEASPSSVVTSKKPENASKTAASPVVKPAIASSKGNCTAARTRVVRPNAAVVASKISANVNSVATSPKRHPPPLVSLPVRPPPRPVAVTPGLSTIPKGSVPARPRPPLAAPARPNAPKRPLPRPAPPLPAQRRPPPAPSQPQPQPLPVRATRPPAPERDAQKPAVNNNNSKPIQQQPPKNSSKSAKAQEAANVLTDVLRRLAKSDPTLAPLTGALEKRGINDAAAGSGKQSLTERDSNSDEDDSAPLDAKVAELEKLIMTIQKN